MKSSWFGLRLDVFIAGAAVMALELMGSRLLAPVYGNTIFVWGSLIGVVLAALSVGYFFGGKLSDIRPNFSTFSLVLFSAGILTLLIPIIAAPVFDWVVSLNVGERYGPLLATTMILAPPSALLGMISPYAIRLAARSYERIGNVSGNLYSLSTIGSILGTFLTVFVLIPQFGVNRIILAVAITLLLASLFGLDARIKILVLILLLLSPFLAPYITRRASVAAYTLALGNVVYETDSPYHHIVVTDGIDALRGGGRVRTLLLDDNFHSAMDLDDPDRVVYVYTDYFNLGFLVNPLTKNVLFIGGGGFTGPKQFLKKYSSVQVDVVEIDAEVIRVAKQYFSVPDDPRLRIFNEDGRIYLHRSEKKYDLIVLDAYSRTFVPFHLMTVEFFREAYEDLTANGVLIQNLISGTVGVYAGLLKAEVRTMATVFPNVYAFPTRGSAYSEPQNVMLVATSNKTLISLQEFASKAMENSQANPKLKEYVENYDLVDTVGARVLTDDFAPVETLLNPLTGQPISRTDEVQPVISREFSIIAITVILAAVGVFLVFRYNGKIRRTMLEARRLFH